MRPVFSFDAETNGLWGEAFAIGALVYDPGGAEVARFIGRLPDEVVSDSWVRAHVLPALAVEPVTHARYLDLVRDFAGFYLAHRAEADVVVHVGFPVEARLLLDARARGFIGEQEAPFPLLDLAGCLAQAAEDPLSVDRYIEKYGITIAGFDKIAPHHPLRDAAATMAVYRHLVGRRERQAPA
jgi:hypothetical protein